MTAYRMVVIVCLLCLGKMLNAFGSEEYVR